MARGRKKHMIKYIILLLIPTTILAQGSFRSQKIDRITVNSEPQITLEDIVRFNALTVDTVPFLNGSKDLTSSSVTSTELGYLSGVTGPIQAQIDGKEPTLTKGDLTESTSSILNILGGTGAVIGSGTSIEVQQASASTDGYLSSSDFTLFSNKQDAISGTTSEIDVTANVIGIADNPVLPGQGSVTLPGGTSAQRPGVPTAGMIRYNTDSGSFEGYTSAWGEIGGGGVGGSRLQLITDPSFEDGVFEGTCTSCTASQDTTIKLGTDNNTASLKMAFSAASGDYTLTKTTSVEYSNVAGQVKAWIKTSANDCHLVEMVDGVESQTVAISSSDEWKEYIINGTTGTTSYGYRVKCNTAITDDVYVDETFAGAAEPDTFDVGTAQFYGSVKWEPTAGCRWARVATVLDGTAPADLDCDNIARTIKGNNNTTDGSVGATDGRQMQISFGSIPAGILQCRATGFMYGSAAGQEHFFAFNDGTTTTTANAFFTNTGSVPTGTHVIGEFEYTSPQGATTIQLFLSSTAGTSYVEVDSSDEEFEISCYHYPAPQKVVAAKCDGLECENEFSVEMTSDGLSNPTIENQTPSGWVDSITKSSNTRWEINVNSSIGNTLECWTSTGIDDSGTLRIRESEQTSTMIPVFNLKADTNTVQNFSSYTATGVYKVYCRRQGSDYNQFDQRMVRVIQEEAGDNWTAYTPSAFNGFGSPTAVEMYWKRDGDDMLLRGEFTTGTTTAVEARIPLPSGYTVRTNIVGSIERVGSFARGSAWIDGTPYLVAESGNTYLSFSAGSTGGAYVNKQNGSDIGTGQKISIKARVPIQGWVKDVNAFIGNLTPKEFVQTPGSTKPVVYSAEISSACVQSSDIGSFISSCSEVSTGIYELTPESSKFTDLNCTVSAINTNENITCTMHAAPSTSLIKYNCRNHATPANVSTDAMLVCHGVQ